MRTDLPPADIAAQTAAPPERMHYGQPNLSGASNARLATCALTPGDPVCQALLGAQIDAFYIPGTLRCHDSRPFRKHMRC